jgi:hypothetical protein
MVRQGCGGGLAQIEVRQGVMTMKHRAGEKKSALRLDEV